MPPIRCVQSDPGESAIRAIFEPSALLSWKPIGIGSMVHDLRNDEEGVSEQKFIKHSLLAHPAKNPPSLSRRRLDLMLISGLHHQHQTQS